ncbi:hypothetical protein QMK61_04785 [Fulvimonas sp. R45]|uniref:hypothetical protein n=1 Tax=Fulvimonas sp. R45 TaxID=3045937 RepID=UPI00265F710E|nr:hypothetical protein [Fulvimonas sp. R45]MDO1528144.1 hypothetical protein [Fulvimonas sp. R45]
MAKSRGLRKAYGFIVSALLLTSQGVAASQSDSFRKIGAFVAPGKITGSAEGPSPKIGARTLYVTRTYLGKGISTMAINPATGMLKKYSNPVKTETTAYGLSLGPDGNMYMGTVPNAHLYRLNTRTQKLEDIGIPIQGEKFVWDLAVAKDGKIYGVTSPHCSLFSFDPKTGVATNLGRMSRQNEFARYIVAGGDGYLYIGTGSTKAGIIAYNIKFRELKEIVPKNAREIGFYHVVKNRNDVVYAVGPKLFYQLHNGNAEEISKQTLDKLMAAGVPATLPKIKGDGESMPIFRLAAGSNGIIFGSTILPMHIFSLNTATGAFENLGKWGDGEAYSLLWHDGQLLIGAYGAPTPLMSYTPSLRVTAESNGASSNPTQVSYPSADEGWRPMAIAVDSNHMAYVGSIGGTGQINGQFDIWNLKTNKVQSIPGLIPNQSIVSLTVDRNGLIYGGTSIVGGSGTTPKAKSAVLFAFNPTTRRVEWQIAPVPGAPSITDLVFAVDGRLFGFAGGTLFEYSPSSHQVRRLAKVDYGNIIYNGATILSNGMIYGLANKGVFVINSLSGETRLVAKAPEAITAGAAVVRDELYFACGSDVFAYKLPN